MELERIQQALAGEKLVNEFFVHDHHRQRFELIGWLEPASLFDRDAHCLEIIGAYDPVRAVGLLTFRRGPFLDVE